MKVRKARAKKALKNRVVYNVLIIKDKDSEEDILYLGKILKKGNRVGIDTFHLHFKEYKELIKKAKRDGKFPKGVKIENINGFLSSLSLEQPDPKVNPTPNAITPVPIFNLCFKSILIKL